MKYSKTFSDLLASPNYDTPEFRASAVQYKKLKKIIAQVISELSTFGLTADLLRELLASDTNGAAFSSIEDENRDLSGSSQSTSTQERSASATAREQSVTLPKDSPLLRKAGSHRKRNVRARASYEFAGTPERPNPRIKLVFSSSEESDDDNVTSSPISPDYLMENLHLESRDSASPKASTSNDFVSDESEDTPPERGNSRTSLLHKIYGKGLPSPPENIRLGEQSAWASQSQDNLVASADDGLEQSQDAQVNSVEVLDDDAVEADDEKTIDIAHTPRKKKKRKRRRVVYLPLVSDTTFFEILGKALVNLGKLHAQQEKRFTKSVQELAGQVTKVSSPDRSKTDLYAWRDVFSLWVEAEIFEGEHEMNRGEHKVTEAEQRLQWFADRVGQRGLAKVMKNSSSRRALEDFVHLNSTLLELKKFQAANEEAVRKILKKHDKQTALTASTNFPWLLSPTEPPSNTSARSNQLVPHSHYLPSAPSLAHVLLATFTGTLLPIIPKVDDYSCMICGDVAYRPIRLDCGHYFCLRDLVKMQKRGQDACPACRAPVVSQASGENLDAALEHFLKQWFPKEVKLKQKDSEREVATEEVEDLEFEHRCRIC